MASTSLSRQLEQLRASSQVSKFQPTKDGSVSVASLGPNILDIQLGGEQLTLLAKEAVQDLSFFCPIVADFKTIIFKDDPYDLMPDDVDEKWIGDSTLDDLLYLLTPFVLKKPTQYLLQYLISRHKIHQEHSEALFFTTLPHYEYSIFHSIVEAIPNQFAKSQAEEEYPKLFENFKRACHPATLVGLTRHLATDSGFFKFFCQIFVQKILRNHVKKYCYAEGVSYDKICHFFTTTTLQALNLSGTIGEHQIFNLMQVILSGLKAGVHKEFRACSIILFGCVVPRVKLNEKVTSKLLKSISKVQPKSTETLSMTALIFRCQIHSLINTERILNEIINHEKILKEEVFTNVSKQVDEDQEFSRRILKCLALLCDKTLKNNENASHEILRLLKIVQHGLGESLPTSDTAEIFIACISQALVHHKSRKKQNKDMKEDEMSCLKSVSSTCTKILDNLRTSFVEEYSKKSYIRPENDIIFVDGYENPSEEIVVAHRTLMENDFIRNFTEKMMSEECNTLEKDLLQSNYNALLKVLLAPNEFLIRQLKQEGIVNLLVNALKNYSHKPKLIAIAFKKLKTLMTLANSEFKNYADKLFLRPELLFLPNLFMRGGQNEFDEMYEIFQELSSDGTEELLMFLKPTIEVAKKEELKPFEFTNLLIEKLCSMDKKDLVDLSKTIQSSSLYDEAVLYSLLIHILTKATSSIDSDCPKNDSSQLYMELISSILKATKKFKVKMKKNKHIHKYLITSRDKNVISSRIFDDSIQIVIQKGDDHKVLLSMLASIWQIRSVNPTLVQKLVEGLRALRGSIEFSSALLCMPIKNIFQYFGEDNLNDEISILKQMHLQATDHMLEQFKNQADTVKKAMDFGSTIIPGLLGGLWNPSKKVRKRVLRCLATCLEKPVARTNYAPLVKALVTNQAAISATSDNIDEVIKAFAEETRSSGTILESLLDKALDCDELLMKLSPIFNYVGKKGMEQLSMHLTNAIADIEENPTKKTLVETILQHNGQALIEHFEEPPIWETFTTGLSCPSTATILHNSIDKLPCCVFLDIMSESCGNLVTKKTRLPELFNILLDLSANEKTSPEHLGAARTLILDILPFIEDSVMIQVLYDIWGQDFFVKSKRSIAAAKNSQRTTSAPNHLLDQPLKWLKTVFFIEVTNNSKLAKMPSMVQPLALLLKKGLHEPNNVPDHSYILDLLISCMLNIVDSFNEVDKETHPLDPELIVQCIRLCSNPDTKASALMLLAKSTASHNAEYILHNTIQLFTFVGTHFLQVESQSNFDIACTAIDVLVPHILQACRDKGGQPKVREMSVNILNTFVDASSDIPRHRFNIFIHQLVKKLGSKEYLWLLTLLLISSDSRKKHASNTTTNNSINIAGASGYTKKSASVADEKNQFLKDLYKMFDSDIDIQVHSLILMIKKTRYNDKVSRNSIGIAESGHGSFSALDLFDVYRVKALSFAQSLLGSEDFVRKVVQDLHLGNKDLEVKLQELLEAIIESIEGFHGKMEDEVEVEEASTERNSIKSEKLQKLLASCLERVFEATLAIIPTRTFVKMLANLLAFEQPKNVQRKALEVLNARLSQQQESGLEEFLISDQLPLVLEKLSLLSLNDSGDVIQQLALMCVKSFAKISTHQSSDNTIMEHMQKLAKNIVKKSFFNSLKQGPVIASALLCIVELFNCLGAHAVIHVKPFITWVLDLVSEQKINELNAVVLNSLVVSVQRTMDNFGGFLNPFYPRLVIATCEMTAWHQNQEENLENNKNEFRQTAQRIKQLQMALSKGIPTHSLIQISKQCFDDVKEKPYAIIALSNIIKENIGELEKNEILASSTPLLDFFMHAFKYREQQSHDDDDEVVEVIDLVEKAVGDAFMTFALKLALDDFKPLYYRLFNLALDSQNLDGITTLFHITEQIANKLKSLFSFVCEMLIQKATSVLQDLSKKAEVSTNKDSRRRIIATSYVLDALASMYKYNRIDSLLMKSYEDHVNAIIEHLNGKNITSDGFLTKIKNCISQLASTTEDETQWKYLNYQVLMLIRSKSLAIRMAVLDIVEAFVQNRGENYLAVLPDSVHFLVEAMEDDDQLVENRCRKLINTMEEVFGQSVQSYFE